MSEPLDELYFTWLYSQVATVEVRHPSRTYWQVLRVLYKKEFVWLIPNDDNRIEDGKDLRYEFIDDVGVPNVDDGWVNLGCSMLELFIGLSRRLSFEAEGEPEQWFWRLMENLDLEKYNDNMPLPESKVDNILDQVIWRTYSKTGRGGLFPLKKGSRKDQREVELWYQLSEYVLDQE